jgi:hypothetical protein
MRHRYTDPPQLRAITMKNLYGINRASTALERDRRTLARALQFVEPDGYEGVGTRRRPRWKLKTVVAALAEHEQKQQPQHRRPTAYNGPGLPDDEVQALIDELQDILVEFDDRCKQLESEPNIEKRRGLDKDGRLAGYLIGAAEQKYEEVNEAMSTGRDIAGKHLWDQLLFAMIDRLMDLLDWELDPKEVEAAQAEHRARLDAEIAEMKVESRARRAKAQRHA